jgi:hypothetical protein
LAISYPSLTLDVASRARTRSYQCRVPLAGEGQKPLRQLPRSARAATASTD